MTLRCTVFLLACVLTAPALGALSKSDGFLAQDLYDICTDETSQEQCVTFIRGARAGMSGQRIYIGFSLLEAQQKPHPTVGMHLIAEPFCAPEDVSDQEIKDVVLEFLDGLGKKGRQSLAGFSILMALSNRYPCSREDYEAGPE